ncbi:MAG TPA: DUF1549 domain-containing protein, partial [Planctomycetota bacterium]|nr:DUF1549 domain-containing protein [Planctomycetota bacterium]
MRKRLPEDSSAIRFPRARWVGAFLSIVLVALVRAPFSVAADVAVPRSDPAAAKEPPITTEDLEHWAFTPLEVPAVPVPRDLSSCRNDIDRLVLARLEENGIEPLPEAGRRTLARRLHFDLTGLPPSPDDVERFVVDPRPDAYERLVDRLLDSPAYAEHQAQRWLDLARFAETDGFEQDQTRPNAWRYRDWVIRAMAEDLPFDELVRQQIAGDILAPDDPWAVIATGFGLAGPDMSDINTVEERRHMVLNDLTATVGSVFLGLTFGCAQCHDHKTDPVSQADFYRLRAYFDELELFREFPLPAGEDIASPAAPVASNEPAKKETAPLGRVFRVPDRPAPPSHVRVRGEHNRLGAEVRPAPPRILDVPLADAADRRATPNASTSSRTTTTTTATRTSAASDALPGDGRRAALAEWLTRPDHPLVPRVMVNRLWLDHFGRGIVETPSDFGRTGTPPTDQRLLDWLATELPRRGFSLR